MKLPAVSMLLALAAGASLAPSAHAQSVAPDYVFMCMAGLSGFGASGGPACAPATDFFFSTLVVWDWSGFDAPATAALRYTYLASAPGAQAPSNLAIINAIVEAWYATP